MERQWELLMELPFVSDATRTAAVAFDVQWKKQLMGASVEMSDLPSLGFTGTWMLVHVFEDGACVFESEGEKHVTLSAATAYTLLNQR